MSKLICYSLFNSDKETFEKRAYIRGFYFNCRMNNLIYPDWRTHLEVDRITYNEYKGLFDWLVVNNNLSLNINEDTPMLCEGMLWRMKPIFTIDVNFILCRDADALTTYREALCVQQWIESTIPFHAINDNPAHAGIMGGMIGFDCAAFKPITEINNFTDLIHGRKLNEHGSDQDFINTLPIAKNCLLHNLGGAGFNAAKIEFASSVKKLPQIAESLWESNLCISFIGAAGFNELETLRFLKRFDEYNWKYQPIEKEFPQLFSWQL